MKTFVGLALGFDSARAVAVRGGKIIWVGETVLDAPESMARGIADLLSGVPRGSVGRPRVSAVIGPAFAQTRIIGGLPPLEDTRLLSRIVREGTSRFFLKNGTPLLTGLVQGIEPGRVWASAFDGPVVDAVLEGCAAARCHVVGVAPTVAVLGVALKGDCILWTDGPVGAEIELAHGKLVAVRRTAGSFIESPAELQPCEELAILGDGAWRFADAYGAAVCASNPPLAIRPGRAGGDPTAAPRWRITLAGSVAGLAIIAALVGPGWMALRTAREAQARLGELAEVRNAAAIAEDQLRRFSLVLDEVAAFDEGRRSITLLLAEISSALPKGNALVTFRVDSTGGTVIALALEPASVMAAVESVPGIASPQIIGPVTRELVGDRELERMTIRFLWPDRAEMSGHSGDADGAR